MASDYFESALSSLLKAQEKPRLLKILTEIRKGVEGPHRKANINKLYEKGCLKQLITNLQEPHLDVLNLSLSILGNCCMERVCAREAVKKYNLLPYLNHLLKHYKQDSIQGRIFRIIGNMCQHWDRLANTVIEKEPQLHIVAKIVACLNAFANMNDETCESETNSELTMTKTESCKEETNSKRNQSKTSDATIMMAVRALRELTNSSTVVPLIKDCEVIKAIGTLLIKLTPLWQSTKQHEDILNVVLKLLYEYSKRYQNYDVISQLQNTDKGNAVTHLGKLVSLSPFVVIKITVNLSEVRVTNLDLPFSDIFQNLIEKLQNPTSFTSGREDTQHKDYLKCLCFLIQHPSIGNIKEEFLNVNLIPTLLLILKDYAAPTDVALKNCIIIISTLKSRYMFENPMLTSMLKHGIVDIILEKLNWILGSDTAVDTNHEFKSRKYSYHKSRKRGRFMSDPCFMNQLTLDGLGIPCCDYMRNPGENEFYKFKERSLSPSSDTSISSGPSFSPPSSPALSLSDTDAHPDDDESDSDDYSPVCSDAEGDQSSLPVNIMEYVPDGFEPEGSTYDEINEQLNSAESTETKDKGLFLKRQLSDQIIKLIKLFAIMRPIAMELNSSNLLIKLLQYLLPSNKSVCPPDTVKVILLVAQTPEYLLGLMQTDFIIAAYQFSALQHGVSCITCTSLYTVGRDILLTFTKLVELGCGQGDIAHQLYRASLPVKQKLVSAIPFLTDNKHTLNNLMITCGGLNILMQLFQKNSELQQKCISGLCVMGKKLGIKNPTFYLYPDEKVDKFVELPIDVQYYELEPNCETIVRFKLDDGTSVEADRNFLSQKSDYFNRLLTGEFKESWEEEIQLHNVPNKSLTLLLMLLQYDVTSTEIHKLDNIELEVLLDVIGLTDRYLMEDLCVCLTMSVQYFKLSSATVPTIYQWSLESRTSILRVETVAFALVASMNESERYNMFQNLLQLGYSEDLANDVQELLTRFLSNSRKD